jgi:hypothetical protein
MTELVLSGSTSHTCHLERPPGRRDPLLINKYFQDCNPFVEVCDQKEAPDDRTELK